MPKLLSSLQGSYNRHSDTARCFYPILGRPLSAGKGIGLVATRNIASGEVLLVSQPLGVVFGRRGAIPDNASLTQLLAQREFPRDALPWFAALLAGSGAGGGASGRSDAAGNAAAAAMGAAGMEERQAGPASVEGAANATDALETLEGEASRLALVRALLHGKAAASSAAGDAAVGEPAAAPEGALHGGVESTPGAAPGVDDHAAAVAMEGDGAVSGTCVPDSTPAPSGAPAAAHPLESSSASSPAAPLYATAPLSEQQLDDLVSAAAYGEAYEDLAAAELREQPPESYLGLWPEFALLNHACAPNTVQVGLRITIT